MRYICKYVDIQTRDSGQKDGQCGCPATANCPLNKSREVTDRCFSTIPFVYGPIAIFSTTIEEHERKFHNIKKDC
jgi:hypothetical protein